MKVKEEIIIEIDRLKKKENANKTFLEIGDNECKNEELIRKHNYIIRKQIKKLEWVLNVQLLHPMKIGLKNLN